MPAISYCVVHCFKGTSPFCKTASFLKGEMVIWTHFSFFSLSFFSLLPRFKCAYVCVYMMLLYCYYSSQHHQSDHNAHSSFVLDSISAMLVCSSVDDKGVRYINPFVPHRSLPVLGGSRRQSLLSCVYIWSSFYVCVLRCMWELPQTLFNIPLTLSQSFTGSFALVVSRGVNGQCE